MNKDLTILTDNRDALLLAEIAMWLHMIGKLQKDFLEGRSHLARATPDKVKNEFPQLYNIFKDSWFGSIWDSLPIKELKAEKVTIERLITKHEDPSRNFQEGFIKLIIDAHGRGSNTDKGALIKFANPHKDPVYLSTSLGFELPINIVAVENTQQYLYQFLQIFMDEIKVTIDDSTIKGKKLTSEEWSNIRSKFIQAIRRSFRLTVADNRRPLNDVTLLDQTSISVAFFKASLAEALLTGWKTPDVDKVEKKYHWRLLQVGIDGFYFWRNSTRVSDILARRKLVATALNKVQTLLEVTYPLGFEVYRDENGSFFVVPDIESLQQLTDGQKSLTEHIQEIAKDTLFSETKFTLPLISERTRNTLLFGGYLKKTPALPIPEIRITEDSWKETRGDVCPVCGLRSQVKKSKALNRDVCNICETNRLKRSKSWAYGILKLPDTGDEFVNRMESPLVTSGIEARTNTIWIDEASDIHGRLALIVARFDITDWLSSNNFNSVLALDPQEHELEAKDEKYPFKLSTFVHFIEQGLLQNQELLKNELSNFILSSKDKQRGETRGLNTIGDVYANYVLQTDLQTTTPHPSGELLALALLRQWPAPARIYRVWQTTRNYWENVVSNFASVVGKVSQRLRLRVQFTPDLTKLYHTYDLKLQNTILSVTKVADQEFVTVDNLQRVAVLLDAPKDDCKEYDKAVEYIDKQLQTIKISGAKIDIEEPTGYGNLDNLLGKASIQEIYRESTSYVPAIPILIEPRTFMALVPADKAIEVAKDIKQKYEEQMGKVRNRLPLTLGIAFAGRRTPLPAILDTGRRMLKLQKDSNNDPPWTVQTVDVLTPPTKIKLAISKDGTCLSLEIPIKMGDGTTEDAWYPYWWVTEDINGARPVGRDRQFKGRNGEDWVHVTNLEVGDKVHYMPSRFDFEFLDTASRRFEVSYENGKRRGSHRPGRPYYLEQLESFDELWNILSTNLKSAQIHTLVGLIETKRTEWEAHQDDTIFQQAVCDIINNANWNRNSAAPLTKDQINTLHLAALSGQLTDIVELYIRILKEEI